MKNTAFAQVLKRAHVQDWIDLIWALAPLAARVRVPVIIAGRGGLHSPAGVVEGDLAVGGVGGAFDDRAAVIGQGGNRVLLIPVVVKRAVTTETQDHLVDVVGVDVAVVRCRWGSAGGVVGDGLLIDLEVDDPLTPALSRGKRWS